MGVIASRNQTAPFIQSR